MTTTVVRMQQRRDSSTRWELVNPVMRAGEMGYDETVDRFKMGDGVTAWTDLPFLNVTLADVEAVTETLVPGLVVEALAADDTPALAAAAAVTAELASRDLIDADDLAAAVGEQIVFASGVYPARTKGGPAQWVGAARPTFTPAKNGDTWIRDKKGLLTEVISLPSLVGYWPMNEGAGTTVNDKTASPVNGAVSGAGAVLGAWNQPGGVGALGLKPKGAGAVSLAAAAKLDVADTFTFGTFFRRRNLRRGTLFQRGTSFFSDFAGELFGNGNFEAAISTVTNVGNWKSFGVAADCTLDTVTKHSGGSALKVHILAANTTNGVNQVLGNAQPGRYRLRFWSLDDPGNPYGRHQLQVSYTSSPGGVQKWLLADGSFQTTSTQIEIPRRDAWGMYEVTFDLPEATGAGALGLQVNFKRDSLSGNGAAYDFWIDDVTFSKAVPLVVGTEQLTNGDFESALGGSAVNAWYPITPARSADVTFDATTQRPGSTGTRSAKVRIQSDNGSNGLVQIVPSATPGRYVLDFWRKDDPLVVGSRGSVQISYLVGGVQKWLNSSGAWQTSSTEIDLVLHDADWTFHRIVFDLADTTMSGGNGLQINMKRLSTSGGASAWDFWIDDASLKKVSTTANAAGFAVTSGGDGSLALVGPDLTVGYKTIASTPPLTDHLGWHSLIVTKNGATTKMYLDGVDVTIAGTDVTFGSSPALVSSLMSGILGQMDCVTAHSFLCNTAISAGSAAAIVAEANLFPDRSPNPDQMKVGTNNYTLVGSYFAGLRDDYAKVLRDMRVIQTREVITWADIQPTNEATYDWSKMDDLVNNLTDQGIEIMAVFDSWAPSWVTGGNPNSRFVPTDVTMVKGLSVASAGASWATYRDRFVTFMVACVHRYKDRIHKWEILNEYNASLFSYPAASAPMYVNFYNTARAAILAEDPKALLAPTSLARMKSEDGTTDAGSYLGDEWLRAILDLGIDPFDFIGWHPYMGENSSPRVHNVNACSYDLGHQTHDTLVEYGRTNVKVPMNENGWYSGATKVSPASVGQSLPQATINVDYTTDSSDGTSRAWLPVASVGSPKTVYIVTDAGVQAITYTGQTATSLTGCTGGTGKIVHNSPVSVSQYVLTDQQQAAVIVDAIAVTRDYMSAWCDYVGLFSIRCYGGTPDDQYNGSSWFYDFALTKPKAVVAAFADAAMPYYLRAHAARLDPVPSTAPQRYVAVGGQWVLVAG